MSNREVVAMLLAGGQGSRLYDLTEFIAKPAVSFGGKYRMIDFSLSNCTNSGIDTIGVLTQYKPMLLNSYLGNGAAWDLDTSDGGLHILPPYYTEKGGNWYKGTSDAVYRNINFIDKFDPKYVIILSGDHIYNMDYNKMLAFHKNSQADLTISVTKVPLEEAPRFGILSLDDNYRITGFQEKPKYPNSNYASMGIYIFNWPILNKALIDDQESKYSNYDFSKDIIPSLLEEKKRLFAYEFKGYWKDCGTIDSYYDSQMALLEDVPDFNIFNQEVKIYSNTSVTKPHHIDVNGSVKQSLVANISYIGGHVKHSVISNDSYIGENAVVEDSILLPGSRVLSNAIVKYAIIGENSIIQNNSHFIGTKENIKLIGDLKSFKTARKDLGL